MKSTMESPKLQSSSLIRLIFLFWLSWQMIFSQAASADQPGCCDRVHLVMSMQLMRALTCWLRIRLLIQQFQNSLLFQTSITLSRDFGGSESSAFPSWLMNSQKNLQQPSLYFFFNYDLIPTHQGVFLTALHPLLCSTNLPSYYNQIEQQELKTQLFQTQIKAWINKMQAQVCRFFSMVKQFRESAIKKRRPSSRPLSYQSQESPRTFRRLTPRNSPQISLGSTISVRDESSVNHNPKSSKVMYRPPTSDNIKLVKSGAHSRSLKKRIKEYEQFLEKIRNTRSQVTQKGVSSKSSIVKQKAIDGYYSNLIHKYADTAYTGIRFISIRK